MERWANKVALVTGAGSGIGAQFSLDLCAHNVIVFGLDFQKESLEKVSQEIAARHPNTQFIPIVCDLTKEEQIEAAFAAISADKEGVDIMVNCAGILGNETILENESNEMITRLIQTNLLAVISCIKKAFKSMSDRDVDGHIVNMCSIAGHSLPTVPGIKPASGPYNLSKFGVNILNRAIGQELVYYQRPKIRISNISPGLVGDTGIFKGTIFDGALSNVPELKPKDISDVLMFILAAPKYVQVREVILEPVGSSFY